MCRPYLNAVTAASYITRLEEGEDVMLIKPEFTHCRDSTVEEHYFHMRVEAFIGNSLYLTTADSKGLTGDFDMKHCAQNYAEYFKHMRNKSDDLVVISKKDLIKSIVSGDYKIS